MTPSEHAAQVEAWHRERDDRLRSPDGWLTLVGLYWLEEGDNHIGAHPANEIVLHAHGMQPRAGTLHLEDGEVHLVPHADAGLLRGGKEADEMRLLADTDGDPTILELGSLRMHLIRRGERIALRVRDREAPALGSFTGVDRFATDPGWRIVGGLEPMGDGTVEIVDVTGRVSREASPGRFTFERGGREWGITALDGEDDTLWLVFGDATNGRETYGGGRFLYTEPKGADGTIVADFNLAYNPPCVFSEFATCPLPPAENRLNLRIEAGERMWHPPARRQPSHAG
ncbi:MAG: DUF1684 domain-containing protein [Chloroflexi bacterium]|nr:MAG: DUF1684 domain-containing protein [Chloroflexota bacterium]